MASLQVRFKNGDTDEWTLHDEVRGRGLVRMLVKSTAKGGGVIRVSTVSEELESTTYDDVGLAMSEVICWRVSGLHDEGAEAALWAELEGLPDDSN